MPPRKKAKKPEPIKYVENRTMIQSFPNTPEGKEAAQKMYKLGIGAIRAQGELPGPGKPGQMMDLVYHPHLKVHQLWHIKEELPGNPPAGIHTDQPKERPTSTAPVYKTESVSEGPLPTPPRERPMQKPTQRGTQRPRPGTPAPTPKLMPPKKPPQG